MRTHLLATTALATTAMTTGALVALSPSAALAATGYTYSWQHHDVTESFEDTGLCSDGPADIQLSDANSVLQIRTNVPLADEDAAWEALDSEGYQVLHVTFTETGAFRIAEADGHVYTGRFTEWWGGNQREAENGVYTSTFRINGTREDGRRIAGEFVGHTRVVDGEVVQDFQRGEMRGC